MVRSTITRDELKVLATKAGLEFNGDQGQISKKGVKANYLYDGQTLSIVVLGHPLMVTAHYCEEQIAAALQAAGVTAEVVAQE